MGLGTSQDQHPTAEDRRFEPLLNFTIRKAAHSQEVKDTLCAMIAGEVSRKQMTSLLFYLKLIVK